MNNKYYTATDAESFVFFRIPKALITNPKYKSLSFGAKFLYGLMFDRMSLSVKNEWFDENGNVYIYYTLEDVMKNMCCGRERAVSFINQLEKSDLLDKVRQGLGKPNKLYIKRFEVMAIRNEEDKTLPDAVKGGTIQKSEKRTCGSSENRLQEVRISDSNNTEFSNNGKGIEIVKGDPLTPDARVMLLWDKVDKRLRELIRYDRYLNPKEKELYPAYLEEAERRRIEREEERYARDILSSAPPEIPSENKVYDIRLGSKVYIGADEYSVEDMGEGILLRNVQYPLITKELSEDDFYGLIRENNLNDHLIVDEMSAVNEGKTVESWKDEEIIVQRDAEKPAEETEVNPLIGKELTIDGRRFVIESVGDISKNVTLRDITFEESTGFPIERVEKLGLVERLLREAEKPKKIDFTITDDNLGVGGAKTKYAFNTQAIKLLRKLERENRLATHEEQEVLSRYVGWGGIPQAFDEKNEQWAKEYAELKQLLTEEEYTSARGSTLNAHFTSPVVIKAMYSALESFGFKTGNILEPACGIGNFFGALPDAMKESKLYGIELDSLTGKIAKQLYQNASIEIKGFEETNLPDSFFDVAVGNVPFGDYKVADKRYDKNNFLIHDYFFVKTLDKVRPGGIIAFITSKGTMDKQNEAVRKYIAERAELIGAVRLPNNAFLVNAGTGVTADIIFLKKRDRFIEIEPSWVHLYTMLSASLIGYQKKPN